MLYFDWASLQTGADAAVLAGANYLPAYPSQAVSAAVNYALLNGIKSGEIQSTTVAADNMSITMKVSRTVSFSFARVLGLQQNPVSATAVAGVQATGKAGGAAPLGLDSRTSLVFGQPVTLNQGQYNGNWITGPGNWDPLALGGTGASNYETNIENGYSQTLSVGDAVQTEPGRMNGPTQTGINYRVNLGQSQYPDGTFANHELGDPRVLLVPVVDFSNVNGSSTVPIKGFAELWLVSVMGNGTIEAYFIEQSTPNTQPSSGAPQYGAYTPVLLQ